MKLTFDQFDNFIFDMDDTLLECGKFYDECIHRFVEMQAERTQVEESIIRHILTTVDVACTALPEGWGKERFPRSFAGVSVLLDVIEGKDINLLAQEESYLLGLEVFSADYPLIPQAKETLEELVRRKKNIFLWTKGDFSIQMEKIHRHGLANVIPNGQIYIVPKKNSDGLSDIVNNHGLDINKTLMIGDSIRDDICSASDINMSSALVDNKRGPWAYEIAKCSPTYKINSVADLL